MPVLSPPTPAPSPRLSAFSLSSIIDRISESDPAHVSRREFAGLSPPVRLQYLAALLSDCTPSELLFVSTTISPLLRRDLLRDLPPEISLHILSYLDDPQALARASRVSKSWNRLLNDQWLWRRMCYIHGYALEQDGHAEAHRGRRVSARHSGIEGCTSNMHTASVRPRHMRLIRSPYSSSAMNWMHGGKLLRTHRIPLVSTSQALVAPRNPADEPAAAPASAIPTSIALDDAWLVVGLANSRIHVFSAKTGVLSRTLVGHESGVWAVALPNALVVSGGCDKELRVWDVKSGYCIHTLRGHTSTIRCLRVLHGRPVAVSGSRDRTLRVWDIQRGRLLRVLEGHEQSVRCLDICGSRVVSGSYDTTCRLWDVDTGACLHVLRGHFNQIYSVAFDGVRVASGGLDTTVRVWDAATGTCLALLQGHTALVCQLQLSPTMLATGGSDGRVIIFALGASYQIVQRLAAHDSSVTGLQLDDRFLVTSGNDGRARLYRFAGEGGTGEYVPVRDLSESSDSVWKVAYMRETCVVMCKRAGKTVLEIWSFKPDDDS
ncbi:hypothetical protein POSPLADRAFT_1182469 [Postia placenta MAD-698-R-SB12]|uniref:F-box domain-containing protein n=1 Tax=Postia placenta MAD-698-R-SB12 TaxID=670580 RepID=A0A1X6MYC3_9APHY|nr:hypothetical protein POSPLADRAFT_1182469 [Postia placenta MAD-698-R-SB12]OSX61347.1 hypothetical protein POSPLADRAFT_1182469 [Postia placenta MAD-698-R-SB12]